jgi:fucose permease
MVMVNAPMGAVLLLAGFAFSMAGVNPVAVAGIGKEMSAASIGVMLPIGAIGAIVMPWLIGQIADLVSLQAGMMVNLIPCFGIMMLSMILLKLKKTKN